MTCAEDGQGCTLFLATLSPMEERMSTNLVRSYKKSNLGLDGRIDQGITVSGECLEIFS